MHKINKDKINWEKGSGEFIGFALISVCISSIIILLIAILQYSSSLNDITKALEAAGRAVAVCTSFEDAEKQAQMVAETAISDTNIIKITTDISPVGGSNEWKAGSYLTVTVKGKYHNPFFGGTSQKTALVTVENATGRLINIPESYNGIPIGTNLTCTPGYGERHWAYKQRTVYEAWVAAGEQYMNGIAVLDGYYLIACSNTFGSVGDKVQFTLENGQVLNCIIADQKSTGDSNYTMYGHIHNGKILVLEMEVSREYFNRYGNPGENGWYTEWNSRPIKCRNMGNYI